MTIYFDGWIRRNLARLKSHHIDRRLTQSLAPIREVTVAGERKVCREGSAV